MFEYLDFLQTPNPTFNNMPICPFIAGDLQTGNIKFMVYNSNMDTSPQVMPISDLQGSKFDLLQLMDVDQDGDLDVITCEERDNLGLVWYENPTR